MHPGHGAYRDAGCAICPHKRNNLLGTHGLPRCIIVRRTNKKTPWWGNFPTMVFPGRPIPDDNPCSESKKLINNYQYYNIFSPFSRSMLFALTGWIPRRTKTFWLFGESAVDVIQSNAGEIKRRTMPQRVFRQQCRNNSGGWKWVCSQNGRNRNRRHANAPHLRLTNYARQFSTRKCRLLSKKRP